MRKQGISLITLIITVVVVIILAAAVVLALSQNNPIKDSRVAQVTQTRDSLTSGILIYGTNVQAKTKGELSVKDILISNLEYRVAIDDENTNKSITKDGVEITLYKLDKDLSKEKLNVDLKNDSNNWYIDEYGIVYLVYDDISSIPEYIKSGKNVTSVLSSFVTYKNGSLPIVVTNVVTYNANGGSGEMTSSTGENITILGNSFTAPAGKEFDSWNTKADGSGIAYAPGTIINEDIILYAKWKDIVYTISYNSNGGNSIDNQTKNYGQEIILAAAPIKDGYEFKYWEDENGTHYNAGATYTIDADVNLTAIYKILIPTDVWDGTVASRFESGTGTQADPYIIKTAEQFAYFSTYPSNSNNANVYFKLVSNIDLDNRAWTIYRENFYGNFNGNGCYVKNLSYTQQGSDDWGLIARNVRGTVSNFGIESGTIGYSSYGRHGISATVYGTIQNCYNKANISNTSSAAGIVGTIETGGRVISCYNSGDITVTGNSAVAGGITNNQYRNIKKLL